MKNVRKSMLALSCFGVIATSACSNNLNDKKEKPPVASPIENTNENEQAKADDEITQNLDHLSEEDRRVVTFVRDSYPEVKEHEKIAKTQYYHYVPNIKVNKKSTSSYEVNVSQFPWIIMLDSELKNATFTWDSSVDPMKKGNLSYNQLQTEWGKMVESDREAKEASTELRANIDTKIKEKLQKKASKNQKISDQEMIQFVEELAAPEFVKYEEAYSNKGVKLERKYEITKPNPSATDEFQRDYYEVKIQLINETIILYIKPTFEDHDISWKLDTEGIGTRYFTFQFFSEHAATFNHK